MNIFPLKDNKQVIDLYVAIYFGFAFPFYPFPLSTYTIIKIAFSEPLRFLTVHSVDIGKKQTLEKGLIIWCKLEDRSLHGNDKKNKKDNHEENWVKGKYISSLIDSLQKLMILFRG